MDSHDRVDTAPASPAEHGGPDLARRQALAKIGIGGALVWSAPLISATAHAQTVPSGCFLRTLDWSTFTLGSTFTSTTVGGVTVSLSSTFGTNTTAQTGNRTIVAGPQGGLSGQFLRLNQTARNNTNNGQTVTFTFSKPITGLSFTITDIDNLNNGWSDRIQVNTAGFGYTVPPGSSVIGIGEAGNGTGGTTTDGNGGSNTGTGSFRNSVNSFNFLPADDDGNLTLTHPGPITSFSFRFWCGNVQGSNQLINISNLRFIECP